MDPSASAAPVLASCTPEETIGLLEAIATRLGAAHTRDAVVEAIVGPLHERLRLAASALYLLDDAGGLHLHGHLSLIHI